MPLWKRRNSLARKCACKATVRVLYSLASVTSFAETGSGKAKYLRLKKSYERIRSSLKLQKLKTYFRPKQWKIYKQPRSSSCSFNMSSMQLLFSKAMEIHWCACSFACPRACAKAFWIRSFCTERFSSANVQVKNSPSCICETQLQSLSLHTSSRPLSFSILEKLSLLIARSDWCSFLRGKKKHPSKNRRSEKKTSMSIVESNKPRDPKSDCWGESIQASKILWRLRVAKLPLSPKSKNAQHWDQENCMNQCQGSLMSKSNWPSLWSKGICWSISWKIMSQQTEPKNLPSIPRCFECI